MQSHSMAVLSQLGEDIDLRIILNGLSSSPNIYFLKLGKITAPQQYYPRQQWIALWLIICCFLHAFSGCNIISVLYGHTRQYDIHLSFTAASFGRVKPDAIAEASSCFLQAAYA